MIFANDRNNNRIHIDQAVVRQEYFCPSCGALLTQRKGEIRQHHFAHLPNHVCTDTWEGTYDMSDWHNLWQARFPYSNQEVLLSFGEMKHRADVLIGRTVTEFQHSSISSKNFSERNNFYNNLEYKVVWVFDLIDQYANGQIVCDDNKKNFTWTHPKNTFNSYDNQSGRVELFFQLKESESEPCLVKVSEVSGLGIDQFAISRWYTKNEFMEYLGVKNGACAPPDREDIYENETYKAFREKYNICLNKQQERAVQAVEGANLLLAVPGSGKTTVLVARLGFMILCKNISPKNVLAMTYTKAATKDMKKRFASMFGSDLVKQLEFRTINGIAQLIIQTYEYRANRKAFALASDNKQIKAIIRDILKEKMKDDYPTEGDINEAEKTIAYIKNMMLSKEEVSGLNTSVPDLLGVYNEYVSILQKQGLMDYDDQLKYALAILRKYPDILESFQKRFKYICVDEAQDTSKLQHEIIRVLAGRSNNIFMVGDEDQSIYGFRAAYPKALTNFKDDYDNPFTIYMELNYRSTTEIVDKSAKFIEKNRGRYDKHMIPHRGHGDPVCRIPVKTRLDQYEYLLEVAKKASKETAILYRDNDSIIPLVYLLRRYNVPFSARQVKHVFFTNRVVSDIRAFLRFALNPFDAESFMKIYYKCNYALNKQTAQLACEWSKQYNVSIVDALQKNKDDKIKKNAASFNEFINDVAKLTSVSALDKIYSRYGKYVQSNKLDYGKFELLKIFAVFESSITSFLAILDELEELFTEHESIGKSGIILSTVHSAKGLEYDTVYLMDIYDGLFPNVDLSQIYKSDELMEKYQEERRLFYVAMTRAKNNLNVISIEEKKTTFADEILPVEKPKSKVTVTQITKNVYLPKVKTREEIEAEQKRRKETYELFLKQQKESAEKKLRTTKDSVYIGGTKMRLCLHCGKVSSARDFDMYTFYNENPNWGICKKCKVDNVPKQLMLDDIE